MLENIPRGVNFHDTTPVSFIKAYVFYFCVGVIFAMKTKARKLPNAKISTFTLCGRQKLLIGVFLTIFLM